jgi:hypothetical protein
MLLDRLCRIRSLRTAEPKGGEAARDEPEEGSNGRHVPALTVLPGAQPAAPERDPAQSVTAACAESPIEARSAEGSLGEVLTEVAAIEDAPLEGASFEDMPSAERDDVAFGFADASNGHEATPDTPRAEPVVRLYLHPGRALIAEYCMDRLRSQFDLSVADRHPDLASAEMACGDESAFLAEIEGPAEELECGPTDRVALLIRGLRP